MNTQLLCTLTVYKQTYTNVWTCILNNNKSLIIIRQVHKHEDKKYENDMFKVTQLSRPIDGLT
jgi:hypothetical protein